MNALLRRLKRDAVVITIHSIPLENMVGVMFSDGSLANNIDLRTQVCYVACVSDSSILDGAEAPTSVIAYKAIRWTAQRRMCFIPRALP